MSKALRCALALALACLLFPAGWAYAAEPALQQEDADVAASADGAGQAAASDVPEAAADGGGEAGALSAGAAAEEAAPVPEVQAEGAEEGSDAMLRAQIAEDPAAAGYTIRNVIEPSEESTIALHVTSEAELRAIADAVNADTGTEDYAGYTIYLDNDIELTSEWTPIGTGGYNSSYDRKQFAGIFDGQGHTISNLVIANADSTGTYNYQGLFGRVSGSTSNVDYTNSTADITKAVVKNVVVKGSISTQKGTAAGIVAHATWTDVSNCGNEANISAYSVAAGIVGEDNFMVSVDSCYNKGNVTLLAGLANDGAAGIVGKFGSASEFTTEVPTISNCYNWGTIISKTTNAGGIVGGWYANSSSTSKRGAMTNCYNAGSVIKESESVTCVAGALVGMVLYYSSDNYQDNHTATNNYSLEGRAASLFGKGGGLSVYNNAFLPQADMQASSFVSTLNGSGSAYKAVEGSYPVLSWETNATAAQLIADATVAEIASLTYNGQAQAPEPEVTYNGTPLVKDTDYRLSYQNNTNAGTAVLNVEGIGSYAGSKQVTFTIDPFDIASASIAAVADQTYHAGGVVPDVSATVVLVPGQDATPLAKGTDYTATGSDNTAVGQAAVTLAGTGNYTGTASASFNIVACNINDLDIQAIPDQAYLGSAVTPVPVIDDGGYTLADGTDFAVKGYSNNNAPALSTDENPPSVTVEGTGNYTGEATLAFTIKNPNIISTEEELVSFRDSVNAGTTYKDTTILLANDIALTGAWTAAIGSASHPFEGTFDGQGNSISNLQLTTNSSYTGLFGYSAGTVKNLSVSGAVTSTVANSSDESTEGEADYIGGIAGYNAGTIQRVSADVAVSGQYAYHVGGIAGRNAQGGAITECENTGYVFGYERVGGIVGSNYGTVSFCYNDGDTESESTYGPVGVGGIAGINGSEDSTELAGVIQSCYNTGIVGIDPDYWAVGGYRWKGGIAGYCNDASSVSNCYDTGLIMPSYMYYGPVVGGFDNGYAYSNNYSLEGLSSVSTAEAVRGTVKTDSEMRGAAFVELLNGTSGTAAYKANEGGYPLLYWQASSNEPRLDLTQATVDGIADYEVTGDAITPLPSVVYRGTTLVKDTDYTLAYSDNINVGTATITITGAGRYYGTMTVTFNITAAAPKELAIHNEEELIAFRDKVNSGYNYGNYTVTLESDIALTKGWTPIGLYNSSAKNAFAGIFDGRGHTVSNVALVSNTGGFSAFFGYVAGASDARAAVKNLIVDGSITSTATANNAFSSGGAAGIVGYGNNIVIENCANKASVTGVRCAAGIVSYLGYGDNEVVACHNFGDVSSTSTELTDEGVNYASGVCAGGIIAYFIGSSGGGNVVESCYNTGTVSSTAYAGGIVGFWYPATSASGLYADSILLANSYSTGTVQKTVIASSSLTEQYSYQGGLVGYVSDFASSSNAALNPIENSYFLDASCGQMIGGGATEGVSVDELSGPMGETDMRAPGFVATLGENYKANAVSTPLLYWEVSAIEGVVVDDIDDAVYTGEAIEPEVTVRFNDVVLQAGTDYTVEYLNNVDAGRASVIVTGTNSFAGTVTESFAITPAPLTLTAGGTYKAPGTPDPDFAVTADGLKGSDVLAACTVTRELGEEVGSYQLAIDEDSVVIMRGEQEVTGNYAISCAAGTLTISDVNLTFDPIAALTYTGAALEPELGVYSEGTPLVAGEDYTVAYRNNVDAGTATAVVTGLGEYAGLFEQQFTIAPAPLTVTADTVAKKLGAADPTFTATASGLVGGDALDACSVTRSEGESAGTYTLSVDASSVVVRNPSGADVTANYKLDTAPGILTIRGSIRYGGADRYETSRLIVSGTFESAEGVIIATGADYPDALAASALAGALGYPIVLTPSESMTSDITSTIVNLHASKAIIVGSEDAVSARVAAQAAVLTGGTDNVTRVCGSNRYETAAEIYKYGLTAGADGTSVWKDGEVILANGIEPADAVSISPYAAGDCVPILLTDGDGAVPSAEAGLLASVDTALIVGGTGRVSSGVEEDLRSSGRAVVRYAGADRYQTSMIVARALVAEKGYTFSAAAFATGNLPYDALCGSVGQGINRSVMLLVNDEAMISVGTLLRASGEEFDSLYYLGSANAVSDDIRSYLDSIAGF